MAINIAYRGTMLSDYFSGTPGVMLTVSVDSTMTEEDVVDQLESEYRSLDDHIEFVIEQHNKYVEQDDRVDMEEVDTAFADLIKGMRNHLAANPPALWDATLEPIDEDDCYEPPVAIWTIEFD